MTKHGIRKGIKLYTKKKLKLGDPKKFAKKVQRITYGILKFLATIWIFRRIHDRIGFEETVVLLLVIMVFLLRYYLKQKS
jgi:hypothetical protein